MSRTRVDLSALAERWILSEGATSRSGVERLAVQVLTLALADLSSDVELR